MMSFEDVLLPEPVPGGPEFWRATVHSLSPLRVERVQGVMPATPENFAGPLQVGDRVFGVTVNTRPVIITRANPTPVLSGNLSISNFTGSAEWVLEGTLVNIYYDLSGESSGETVVAYLPAAILASDSSKIIPGAEYQTPVHNQVRPAFVWGDRLRVPNQPGVTRRRGTITYRTTF